MSDCTARLQGLLACPLRRELTFATVTQRSPDQRRRWDDRYDIRVTVG